jgi:hypothetical protein
MAMNTLPAPVRPANPLYRVGRVGGGGLYNGYAAPRAKQRWEVGQVVNVGFIKGLVVKARVLTPGDGRPDIWALWQPSTNRFYQFQPHLGLSRVDSLAEAMEA